jgi:multidrug efflux pump subunit AcrA (membrane-fusion protein)
VKFNIKTLGIAFVAGLAVLVFFSKTVYNYNLPFVTAAAPVGGKLSKLETSKGVANWARTIDVYSEAAGIVAEILAEEGDRVAKGQEIIKMSFDEDDALDKLASLNVTRERYELDLENFNVKRDNLNRKISELKSDDVSDFELTQLAYEIEKAETDYAELERERDVKIAELADDNGYKLAKSLLDAQKAEEDLNKQQVLLNAGVISQNDYDQSKKNFETLQSAYEDLKRTNAQSETDNAEKYKSELETALYNIESKKRQYENLAANAAKSNQKSQESVQSQLNDYAFELATLERDVKSKELDLKNLDIEEAALKKTLETFSSNLTITAPEDGTVIFIGVNKGQFVNENFLALSFGAGNEFIIECNISLDNNFTAIGDEVELSNAERYLKGAVTKVTPTEGVKKTTVAITSEELSAGETFDLKFEKRSAKSYTLVPNGAVNQDSEGYFLYQIKRRDGILGKEFYAAKQRIYIGDSDTEYTEIIGGVDFFEPIALSSDKTFSEGDTIKLKNEADFFAN